MREVGAPDADDTPDANDRHDAARDPPLHRALADADHLGGLGDGEIVGARHAGQPTRGPLAPSRRGNRWRFKTVYGGSGRLCDRRPRMNLATCLGLVGALEAVAIFAAFVLGALAGYVAGGRR